MKHKINNAIWRKENLKRVHKKEAKHLFNLGTDIYLFIR